MSEKSTETWSTSPAIAGDIPLTPLRLRREPTGEPIDIATGSALVGRHSSADLRLDDPDISRRHCRIGLEDGLWRVRDLASSRSKSSGWS